MKFIFAIIGSLLLLAIAAFCVFGFLASFEPSDTPVPGKNSIRARKKERCLTNHGVRP